MKSDPTLPVLSGMLILVPSYHTVRKPRPQREVHVERNQGLWPSAKLPASSQHQLAGHVSEPSWKCVPG